MKKSLLVLGGAALLGFTAITPPASAQTLPSNDGRSSSPSLDNPGITATITDPIYRTPYPRNTPPGRLVAVEKADWKLIYPFVAEYPSFVWWQDTYKIAFTTEDSLGKPVIGTALLTQPYRAKGAKYLAAGNKIWVNAQYINGLSLRCTPSQTYKLWMGDGATSPQVIEGLLAAEGASNLAPKARSLSVLTPDLLGVNMAYGVNIASGRLMLDAMRALQHAPSMGYDDPDFVVQGFSGGAMASAAAATLMPTYAPSLLKRTKAIFMGGTPMDMISISAKYRKNKNGAFVQKGNEQIGMGLAVAIGLSRQYPALHDYLYRHLTPHGREVVHDFNSMCLSEMVDYVKANQLAMNEIVDRNLLDDAVLDSYLRKESVKYISGMPTVFPGQHLYLYHGNGDVDVPVKDVWDQYYKWLHHGVNVSMTMVPSRDHISAQPVSIGPLISEAVLELYRPRTDTSRPLVNTVINNAVI